MLRRGARLDVQVVGAFGGDAALEEEGLASAAVAVPGSVPKQKKM